MKITIKEPATGEEIELYAQPEDYNGVQGWRIIYPEKDSFVIVQQNGGWKVMDEEDLNPEILTAIGEALKNT
jgi:hypothetical protein